MRALRWLRRSRANALAMAAAPAAVAFLLAACGSSDPPPTSPLDDRSPEATAPPGVETGTPPPLGTATPSLPTPSPAAPVEDDDAAGGDGAGNGAGALPADHEPLVAQAIELVAGWIDVPATELELAAVEAWEWGDACLGVHRPDLACADVVTPGVRVELQTALGATTHVVHVSDSGRFVWAHESEVSGEIVTIDEAASALQVTTAAGEEMWLVVAGSQLEPALPDLAPGMPVVAGLDVTQAGSAIVWLIAR